MLSAEEACVYYFSICKEYQSLAETVDFLTIFLDKDKHIYIVQ